MRVWSDGGCKANGTSDATGYGSFKVEGEPQDHAFTLTAKTNNQAEYMTLVEALTYCQEKRLEQVEVRMDSQLVVEQVAGRWNVNQPELIPLRNQARRLLNETGARLTWVRRNEIVEVLGH